MSLFDNKCYKTNENPSKLVIFVHGYNGCPEDIEYAIQWLMPKLNNAIVVVPRAPYQCEKDSSKLQWLSFFKSDPEARFRNPEASVDEIFEIFNKLGDDFSHISKQMNEFINEQQKLWNIQDKNTFIMGFSQGAMISFYTAFTRKKVLGGCISIAGIVAGKDRLATEICSKPSLLVLHGKDDITVQYKTLPTTLKWYQDHEIKYQLLEFDNLAHRMSEDEMKHIADFINAK